MGKRRLRSRRSHGGADVPGGEVINTFTDVIKKVLLEYQDVFHSKLQKFINVPPAVLNVVKRSV